MTIVLPSYPQHDQRKIAIEKYYYSAKNHFLRDQFLKGLADFDALIQLEKSYLLTGFFRQAVVRFMTTPQTVLDLQEFVTVMLNPVYWHALPFKLLTDLGPAKQQLLEAIKALQEPDLKKQALWQLLSKATFLGALFCIPRGWFNTSFKRGSLYEAASHLQTILQMEDAGSAPVTQAVLVCKLRKSLLNCSELKYYFPFLRQKVTVQHNNFMNFDREFTALPRSFFKKPRVEQNRNNGFLRDETVAYVSRRFSI
jgi:hypothetical protein